MCVSVLPGYIFAHNMCAWCLCMEVKENYQDPVLAFLGTDLGHQA